jgi:hypothetical protein
MGPVPPPPLAGAPPAPGAVGVSPLPPAATDGVGVGTEAPPPSLEDEALGEPEGTPGPDCVEGTPGVPWGVVVRTALGAGWPGVAPLLAELAGTPPVGMSLADAEVDPVFVPSAPPQPSVVTMPRLYKSAAARGSTALGS